MAPEQRHSHSGRNRPIIETGAKEDRILYARISKLACLVAAGSLFAAAPAWSAGDYPTISVADYVYACMKTNGETRRALEKCSCSIDVVASILPFDQYETAETFRRMSLTTGEASSLFRETEPAKQAVAKLRRAQAEAEVRCF